MLRFRLKKHRFFWIFVLLFFFVFLKIFLFSKSKGIFWDGAVYVGMAKSIYSLGKIGLFENIRPLGWPLILGFFWRLGFDVVSVAKILELLFSIGIIFLVYLIAKEIFDERVALLSSVFIILDSTFFFFSYRLLAGIPSLFFVLLGIYLLLRSKFFLSGIFMSIAFLIRFPSALFFLIASLYIFLQFKEKSSKKNARIKTFFEFLSGSAIILIPFFAFNKIKYGNFFEPLVAGSIIINKVVACNYLFKQGPFFYFFDLVKRNFLVLLAIPSFILLFKKFKSEKFNPKRLLIILCFVLPFAYFNYLGCKESRYSIIFIPFLFILSAFTIIFIGDWIKKKKLHYLFILFGIILISSLSFVAYSGFEEFKNMGVNYDNENLLKVFSYIPKANVYLSTSPFPALFVERKIVPLYLALTPEELEEAYMKHFNKSEIFIFSKCDVPCAPKDFICKENLKKLSQMVISSHRIISNHTLNNCEYYSMDLLS